VERNSIKDKGSFSVGWLVAWTQEGCATTARERMLLNCDCFQMLTHSLIKYIRLPSMMSRIEQSLSFSPQLFLYFLVLEHVWNFSFNIGWSKRFSLPRSLWEFGFVAASRTSKWFSVNLTSCIITNPRVSRMQLVLSHLGPRVVYISAKATAWSMMSLSNLNWQVSLAALALVMVMISDSCEESEPNN